MSSPKPLEGLNKIAPYVGGEAEIEDMGKVIKLASNEGAFGPSPKTIEALRTAAKDYHRYPDGDSLQLRELLSSKFNLETERIICGCGSDELISLLCRSYAGSGDEILCSAHGFAMYPIYGQTVGAEIVTADEDNITIDVNNLLEMVTENTKLLFIANPNNPTGTYLPESELKRLHEGLPGGVLLVIDSAYAEYTSSEDYSAGIDIVRANKNVAMLRTFSKIYGMGGVRLGWGYFPEEVADVLNRMRSPFNVSYPAQVAGATAILDEEFIEMSQSHNNKWLAWTIEQCRSAGLVVPNSYCNFALLRFPEKPNDDTEHPHKDAKAANSFLKSRGIIVRGLSGYGLPDALRVSIGQEDEMRLVVSLLQEFME